MSRGRQCPEKNAFEGISRSCYLTVTRIERPSELAMIAERQMEAGKDLNSWIMDTSITIFAKTKAPNSRLSKLYSGAGSIAVLPNGHSRRARARAK